MVITVVCVLDGRYIKVLHICIFVECLYGKFTLNESKMNCTATVLKHWAVTGAKWRTVLVMNRSMKAIGFGNVHWTGLLQVWGLMVWFCVMMWSICFCMGHTYCVVLCGTLTASFCVAHLLCHSLYLYMGVKMCLSHSEKNRGWAC